MIKTWWNPAAPRPPLPVTKREPIRKPKESLSSTKRIFAALKDGPLSSVQIAEKLGIAQQTARGFLHSLDKEGMVIGERTAGRATIWRLK